MLKRNLSWVSTLMIGILTGSSVVSCMSNEKLMNRIVDTQTFYGIYRAEPTTWASAQNLRLDDFLIIANVSDALLQRDEYNNIVADLADGWTHSEDYKTWTIHLDQKAEWFNHQGDRELPRDKGETFYRIKPHHMANTVRYIFNPLTISQTHGNWRNLMSGGIQVGAAASLVNKKFDDFYEENKNNWNATKIIEHQRKKAIAIDVEIAKYIKGDLPNTYNWSASQIKEREDFQKTYTGPYILEVDNDTNTVVFNMLNPTEFFESIIAFGTFAPMPDESVDWLEGSYTPVKSSINAYNYGKSYAKIFNSGAYYVKKINPSTAIHYVKNPNYRNADKTYIKNVILNYSTAGPDSSKSRIGWENNDVSDVKLSPNDLEGWNRYAGKNWETETAFEGAHVFDTNQFYSQALMFNYMRKDSLWKGNHLDNPINWAMAQRSTRALINYGLNSQAYVKYFSKALDTDPNSVSMFTSNRFTPQNLVSFDDLDNSVNYQEAQKAGISGVKQTVTDYTQLVNDNYLLNLANPMAQAMGIKDFNGEVEAQKVNNGNELFLGNDYMAYNALTNDQLKVKFKNSQTYEQKIQVLIEQVKADFRENEIPFTTSNPGKIKILDRQVNLNTSYPFLLQMSREFNAIPNIPINFETYSAVSNDDYASQESKGDYNVLLSGWGGLYEDPSTYLNTQVYRGDYEFLLHRDEAVNENFEPTRKQYASLAKDLHAYTHAMKVANSKVNYERYNELAKQEVKIIYEYMLFRPIHMKEINKQVRLTYLDPFTESNFEIGTSRFKYFNKKMIPKLWTNEQFLNRLEEYNDKKAESKINAKATNKLFEVKKR